MLDAFGAPPNIIDAEALLQPNVVTMFGAPPHRIDLLSTISGVGYDEASQGGPTIVLDGVPVRVIAREALLRNKRAAGRRYQVSAGGGQQSVCGPGGRTLHYVGIDGDVLVRAALRLGTDVQVTGRDTLIRRGFYLPSTNGHPTYDVMPDGRLLLIRRLSADAPPVVVLNWATRLARAEK